MDFKLKIYLYDLQNENKVLDEPRFERWRTSPPIYQKALRRP